MKAPRLEELNAKWAELQPRISGKRSDRKMVSDVRELLEQAIEAGTDISKGAERAELQTLAREIADAIFHITSEYPTATIRAPIDVTTDRRGGASGRSALSNLPERNPFFTGRERVLAQLQEALATHGRAALSGLGGVGKTQTASEYAHRHLAEYDDHAFWVKAGSQEALISSYVTVAGLLQLPESTAKEQTLAVDAVQRWLSSHEGWLLILDNVQDSEMVHEYIPPGKKGHVILTTRAQAVGTMAQRVEVREMGVEEGALFLLRRAKYIVEAADEDDRARAKEIVAQLDGLPLALDQAGAYIEETGCGFSGYLSLYRTRGPELLRLRGTLAFDHPDPVATTWALSFENIEKANPAAVELLRFCAFLRPDGIPEEVFSKGAPELGLLLESLGSDALAWNDALREILKYSLLRRDSNANTLEIHLLVQAVLKQGMDEAIQRLWAGRTVRALNRAFPEVDFSTWAGCERLLPQAHTCSKLINQWGFEFREGARLLNRAGAYLYERGRYTDAESLYQQAFAILEKALGPEYPDVATSLNNLARLYAAEGQYAKAEPLYERALAILGKALGPEHPDLAWSLDSLGRLYQAQGRYGKAEPLFERAVQIREKSLGSENPDLAWSLNSLAALYQAQGQYGKAEPLFERARAIRAKVLGPEHPDLAQSLDSLARLYDSQGQYAKAEPLFQRALAIRERALGPEHPDLATSLNDMAGLYAAQGQYTKAEPLFQRALAIRERALGPEHPDVAWTLNDLASLYGRQGQYAKAEPLYQRALAIRERALGPEHPDVAWTLNDLARLYAAQGQYTKAEPLYQRALTIREKAFGPEHRNLAWTLNDLAALYAAQSQYAKAEPLYQRALETREKASDMEHPDVATCLESYAGLLRNMDRSEEAAPLESRARSIRAKSA